MKNRVIRTDLDEKWFRDQIARAQYSLRGFARALNWDPNTLSRLLTRERRLQLDEVEKVAALLGVPKLEVLAKAGLKVSAPRDIQAELVEAPAPAVPIGGIVDAVTGEVLFRPNQQSRNAPVVALTVVGDPFLEGWRVLCAPGDVSASPAEGAEAGIVQTRDGRVLLRKLRPSFTKGRFDLGPVFGFGSREDDVDVVGIIPVSGLER